MDDSTSIPVSDNTDFIEITTNIVAAYVSNNSVRPADMPTLLADVHAAIVGLNGAPDSAEPKVEKLTAAQVRKSIKPDGLISFIDGKPYKTLKRHLTGNGLTPTEYRERFGLPVDYPMTSASYSAMRAEFARSTGLGQNRQKAAAKAANPAETVSDAAKTRGRKNAAEAAEKPARGRKPKKAAAAE
ncbi:MucR family transcriptional regulator [Methylobacterium sp. E-046]|uniref:MucR family transcriptional regulator n=1 Tax=Methylobacterium sp. E-046 TaxID=2836576 RepID=UPI001FBAE07E|nr:MucR family transcriptional regulator [Methylobacterium sp. E-046]MCJ2102694.1 MucR family transcriptional regulator [Methylobacterium sp. E-046]